VLFNLAKAKRITEKEALAKASNPAALEMNFKGISSTKAVALSAKWRR